MVPWRASRANGRKKDRSGHDNGSRAGRKRPVWGISKKMLDLLCEASKDSLPNEFYAKLIADEGIITEFSIIQVIAGKTHVIPLTYQEPPDISLKGVGTAHSHPSGVPLPSGADLQFFSKMGNTHIIIGYPYTSTSWRAYDGRGRPVEIEVVDLMARKRKQYLKK